MLTCNQLTKSYGVEPILTNITFKINDNDRIGIVGKNGAGKTTLFKLITGNVEHDTGDIFIQKNTTLGYLSQNLGLDEKNTIYNELLTVYKPLMDLEKEIEETQIAMGQEKNNLENIMKKYTVLTDQFLEEGGYEYESRIKGMLNGLGINEQDYNKDIEILSGGQKTRVALAKLLLKKPHLLLLDEPTNFLDIEAMQWLENYLKNYRGAIVLISHDRFFLDAVVTKIFEIENHQLTQYTGNYSTYVQRKKENYDISVHQYQVQQKEIQRQKEIIQRFRQFNREKSIRKAESREKMLEKVDLIDKPLGSQKKVNLELEPQIKSGKVVLEVTHLDKSYGNTQIIEGANFTILRGQKIGIIGQNGTGKSTLLNILMGQVSPDKGNINVGHNVYIDFFKQEQENLNKDNTILQEVWQAKALAGEGEIRNILAMFRYTGEEVYRSIDTLSGGEVSRVALAKIMLSKSNFLLMDEPTNHLDMETKEVLEYALSNYLGTALIVSHDRYFLNRVVDTLFLIENNHLTVHPGNYDDFLRKINEQKLLDEINNQPATITKTQQTHQKKKEHLQRRALKELKTEIANLENQIEETEKLIKTTENEMCQENFYDDYDMSIKITEDYHKAKDYLSELMENWTEKQTELENSKSL